MKDGDIDRIKVNISKGKALGFVEEEHEVIRFRNRICVPQRMELNERIMSVVYNTKYSIHLGGTKVYIDLRQTFWWSSMKRDITQYLDKCLIYTGVKAKHQQPVGELKQLEIST